MTSSSSGSFSQIGNMRLSANLARRFAPLVFRRSSFGGRHVAPSIPERRAPRLAEATKIRSLPLLAAPPSLSLSGINPPLESRTTTHARAPEDPDSPAVAPVPPASSIPPPPPRFVAPARLQVSFDQRRQHWAAIICPGNGKPSRSLSSSAHHAPGLLPQLFDRPLHTQKAAALGACPP